jgi:hypothetical protein
LGAAVIAWRHSFDAKWTRLSSTVDGLGGRWESPTSNAPKSLWAVHPLAAAVCLLAIAWHWPTVSQASFLYDDFDFLRVDRAFASFSVLLRPHGDHVMPLYRLEVMALDRLFGTNPLGWNLALLSFYALALWTLAIVFRQLKIHPVAAAFALAVLGFGRPAASLLMGYYCLSAQLQPITLGLLAFAAYHQGYCTGRKWYDLGGHCLLFVAALVDITGAWVVAGIPFLFVAATYGGRPGSSLWSYWQTNRRRILGWLLVALAAACFYGGVLCLLYPGTFLNLRRMRGEPMGLVGSLGQLINYGASGVVLQMFLPVPERLPVSLHYAALGLALSLTGLGWWVADQRLRRLQMALLALVLLQGIEVCIARPQSEPMIAVQLVIASHVLCAILLGVLLHSLWQWCRSRGYAPAFWSVFALGGVYLMLVVGGVGLMTYRAKLAAVQRLHRNIRQLGQCFEKSLRNHGPLKCLPTLDPRFLEARFPTPPLDFGLAPRDLSFYYDFLPLSSAGVRLCKSRQIESWTAPDVIAVDNLRQATDEGFIEALRQDDELRSLYCAGVELKPALAQPLSPPWPARVEGHPAGGGLHAIGQPEARLFRSAAGGQWSVVEDQVNPMTRSLLCVDISKIDAPRSVRVLVEFAGDLEVESQPCWWTIKPEQVGPRLFDLRQIPVYCLNRSVRRVALRFETEGTYCIRCLSFGEASLARTVIVGK